MAKCPHCGKEIDHIDVWSLVYQRYIFIIDEKGFGDYKPTSDRESADEPDTYHCPHCKEQIAWDEEEATEILKKKDEWKIS